MSRRISTSYFRDVKHWLYEALSFGCGRSKGTLDFDIVPRSIGGDVKGIASIEGTEGTEGVEGVKDVGAIE